MGTRPFMPEPLSDAQKRETAVNQEHLRLLEARLKVLQPRARGGPAPRLNIRLQIPTHTGERYVFGELPQVQADVLTEMGLDTSLVMPLRKRSYDLSYIGVSNAEEFEYARSKGLLTPPGLWFGIKKER